MNKQVCQRRSPLLLIALACLVAISSVSGCASTKKSWRYAKNGDFKRAVGMKSSKPDLPEVPTRIVSTWTDTVLQRTGKAPQRGFGGRIIFFNRESEDPIRVDGQLVVYAYDETDRKPHETHPTRKYVFPKESFVRHESDSQLGPSYSVWIPWDEVGGDIKHISLIARFDPDGANYVMGEQTKHLLPGVSKEDRQHLVQEAGVGKVDIAQHTEKPLVQNVVQQLSAETPVKEQKAEKAEAGMSTTTISLPKRWEKRLSSPKK